MGAVSQENVLFSATLRDNITYGMGSGAPWAGPPVRRGV